MCKDIEIPNWHINELANNDIIMEWLYHIKQNVHFVEIPAALLQGEFIYNHDESEHINSQRRSQYDRDRFCHKDYVLGQTFSILESIEDYTTHKQLYETIRKFVATTSNDTFLPHDRYIQRRLMYYRLIQQLPCMLTFKRSILGDLNERNIMGITFLVHLSETEHGNLEYKFHPAVYTMTGYHKAPQPRIHRRRHHNAQFDSYNGSRCSICCDVSYN